MIRKTPILFVVLMIFGVFSLVLYQVRRGESVDAYSGSGTGTTLDPYLVTSCLQLAEIGAESGAVYLQTANIDCSGTPVMVAGFTGTYDGGNFTISNLSLTTNAIATGLFATTAGATIRNTHLVNIQVSDTLDSPGPTGTLIGIMNGGTVDNCSAQGSVTEVSHVDGTWTEMVGGFIGHIQGAAYVHNSTAAVTVNYGDEVYGGGGFVGETTDNPLIENCSATGNVTVGNSSYFNGGFVGWMLGDTTIRNSFASGDLYVGNAATMQGWGSYDHGGVVGGQNGENTEIGNTLIENSYATGDVYVAESDSFDIGGFVGTAYDGATITRCYSTGNVTAPEIYNEAIGGFVGLTRNRYGGINPHISESFSTGAIQTGYENWEIGGFVGEHRNGTIENSYTRSQVIVGHPGDGAQDAGNAAMFVGWLTHGVINNAYAANTFQVNTAITGNNIGSFNGITPTWGTGVINNSYWDVTTGGNIDGTYGGTPQSTAAMKLQGTFSGWDFSTIWVITPAYNDGYPGFIAFAPTATPTPDPSPPVPSSSPSPSPSPSVSPAPSLSPSPSPITTAAPSVSPSVSISVTTSAIPSVSPTFPLVTTSIITTTTATTSAIPTSPNGTVDPTQITNQTPTPSGIYCSA